MRPRSLVVAVLLLLAAAPQGRAQTVAVAVRTGNHPTFGRVVFDIPPGQTYKLTPGADHLEVSFGSTAAIRVANPVPRNVRSIAANAGSADIVVAPGAKIQSTRLGDRLLIDVFDPASASAPAVEAPAAVPVPRAVVPPAPAPVRQATNIEAPRRSGPPPALDSRFRSDAPAAPAAPPTEPATPAPAGPVAIAAAPVADAHAITLPFAATTGAAAFRRGDEGFVVFDERRPVDMAALPPDPMFAGASIALLPAGTVMRMKLAATDVLSLARDAGGWRVTVASAESRETAAIRPMVSGGRLRFPAASPGGVVSLPDPVTGRPILVGVQKQPGQAIAVQRRTVEFEMLPTWLGVAIVPLSDSIALQASPDAFVLSSGPVGRLALGAADGAPLMAGDARGLSRRYDFPDLPRDELLRRLQAAIATAAAAPAQARAARRIEVAQALIALGMGVEAQSVLSLAGTDDGRAAADPDIVGLGAIGALLGGRYAEANGLLDPRLSGSDEIAFWRAILTAKDKDGAIRAAPVLAATRQLVQSYPQPLRARLLPLVAETLTRGGEREAAKAILADNSGDPTLDLARAMLEDPGNPEAALAIYDKVAARPDRQARARALERGVLLRLKTGALTPAQAADALERQIYAWRGDAREIALRERVATLRGQLGQARPALAMLRETEIMFPDASADLRKLMGEIFTNAIHMEGERGLAPLDLVALAEENGDLIPEGEAGHRLAMALADRLEALDLPQRAETVLSKLLENTNPGDARGELGGRLAALQLGDGDAESALATLADTAHQGPLPAPLLESRTITYAKAIAAQGHLPDAVAALQQLSSDAALEVKAGLLEAAKDWPGATDALIAWTNRVVPLTGALDEVRARALLRLAAAAANAGDEKVLTQLRERDAARMPEGKTAEMFRLLTARAVQASADLPRLGEEVARARGVFPTKTAAR